MSDDLEFWLKQYAEKFGDVINIATMPSVEYAIKAMRDAIEKGEPIPEPPLDVDL